MSGSVDIIYMPEIGIGTSIFEYVALKLQGNTCICWGPSYERILQFIFKQKEKTKQTKQNKTKQKRNKKRINNNNI